MKSVSVKLKLILVALLFVAPAMAQTEYTAPDRELWEAMGKAFGEISMPLAAHQQVQNIMSSVQQQAQIRAAQAKAKSDVEKAKTEKGKE